jgi:tetratricopeptide (TPR) repeat protein
MVAENFSPTKFFQAWIVAVFVPLIWVGLGSVTNSAETVDRVSASAALFGVERSSQLLAQREQKERRTALVIGNGNYGAEGNLRNPSNDATDVAKALRELGFEVTLLKDAGQQQMDEAIEKFNSQLKKGGVGLFYYAGHGVQVGGQNYLIPIGAKINREQDISYKTIPLEQVLGAMEEARNPINIVIIDACRDNPSLQRFTRTTSRGLAPLQREPKGMLIAFATAPGAVAKDGDGKNSPYTTSLLQYLQEPGVPLPLLFERVGESVSKKTAGQQIPRYISSGVGWYAFNSTNSFPPPPVNSTVAIDKPTIPASSLPNSSTTSGSPQEREVTKLSQDATDLANRGNYTDAVKIITQLIQINPNDSKNYTFRGYLYSELDKHQQAIQDFNQAISLNPNDGDAFRKRGFAYFSLKDEGNAIRDLNRAVEINSQDVVALYARGMYYYKMEDNRNALKDLDKAIAIKADEDVLFLNRSFVHYRLGNQSSALQDINRAIELNPKNSEAFFNRGKLYRNMKDDRKALKDFDQAISINDDNDNFFYFRGLTYVSLKDEKSAIRDFTRAIAINPKDAYPFYQRGMLYYEMKDDQKALQDFDQAISINDNDDDFFYFRGLTYARLKDEKSAIRDFTRAIAINPKDAYPFYQRGMLYYEMKDNQKALQDFNQAISINSNDEDFFFFRGLTHTRLQDEKSAIQDFTRSIAINSKNAAAFFERGVSHYNVKDDRNALKDFDQFLQIKPNNSQAFYFRGITKIELNDREGAISDLKNAIQIYQNQNNDQGVRQAQTKLEELLSNDPISGGDIILSK